MNIVKTATRTDDLAGEDLIDLRDLLELRDSLAGRTRCDVCGDEAVFVTNEDGEREIAGHNNTPVGEPDYDHQAEIADPLDEDEADLLTEIERFDTEEVNGDVHVAWSADSPTLINERYWDTYAEEDANELVLSGMDNEVAQRYFDYERFAADYRQDFEEVTLAGTTFLRRSF